MRQLSRVFLRGGTVVLLQMIVFLLSLCGTPAGAQDPLEEASRRTGLSKEELLRRYQSMGGSSQPDTSATEPGLRTIPPTQVILPFDRELMREAIEIAREDSVSTGRDTVSVFGEEFFRGSKGLFAQGSFGPVPEDYVVGVGDQIVVEAWGDAEFRVERIVDRDGTILLPKGGKILSAGKTLAQVRSAVRQRLSEFYSGISTDSEGGSTSVDVTLGKLRAIRVFVIGEASRPGAYEVSSVSSIFTALYAAGGPSPNGSMRDIRLVRGGKLVTRLDLYRYLTEGDRSQDLLLQEHDTILIPPRQRRVTLRGEIRRPITFELVEGETMADLLRYSGGFTAEAAIEVLHIERILPPAMRAPGQPDRVQVDVSMDPVSLLPVEPGQSQMYDGDIVTVNAVSSRLENWVEIAGAVKRPGRFQFRAGMDVRALLERAGQTWPDLLDQRATIDRIEKDGTYRSYSFRLDEILAGDGEPVLLQPMDQVRVFSRWELQERPVVTIRGEVRSPGPQAYREGMTLRDLVLKAGGFLQAVDSLHAEVYRLNQAALSHRGSSDPGKIVDVTLVPLGSDFLTRSDGFLLQPYDEVAVRRLPWWGRQRVVTLRGEVLYPGPYALERPDESVSDIIQRAGGLKSTAYPEGARVIRQHNGVGNVALDLPCALHDAHENCDLVLLDGDEVLIPARENTVKVIGSVGFETSIPYVQGKRIGYYVNRAGGYADGASRWKARVVYPNGMSRPIRRLWWDPNVKPGSTIVVPADLRPKESKDRLDTFEKLAAIAASVATTYLLIDRVK